MCDTHKNSLDALRASPTVLEALLRGYATEQARRARGGNRGRSLARQLSGK